MEEFSANIDDETNVAEPKAAKDSFASLFEETNKNIKEGEVVEGKVVAVNDEFVTIDIGFKCEGLVPLYEFKDATGKAEVEVGSMISVYLDRLQIDEGFVY